MTQSNAFARVVHVLPQGETAATYSARCSRAASSFVIGARSWDKRDLVGWLMEEYRPAVFDLEPTRRKRGVGPLTPSMRLLQGPVTEEAVHALLDRTVDELEDVLVEPELLVAQARQHLDVIASIDAYGDPVYLAVARPRMRLSRRVAALVAVAGDYVEAPRSSGAFLTRSVGGVVRATRYGWVSGDR